MDRQIVYSGQVPQTTDLLNTNKQTMIALAKLCADLFGTSTVVSGLNCVPTSPASMSVNINPGQIYQQANLDGTPYSALPQDTAHSLLKQGILMDAQSFTLTAPATTGYSQNYLIQAAYLDNDIGNVVLPYYNSANPSQAFNGPGGSGASQPTTRAGQVSLQLVAGTAAPTNTQITPAVTAGYVGLAVITVANGQGTVTNASIVPYPNVPTAPVGGLLAAVGERYSSIQNVAVSSVLTTAALGALVNVTSTGQTITLPPAANCPNGTSICVTYMQASGSATVTRNGADTLAFGQGNGGNSLVLNPGEAVQFVSNGVNGWVSAGQTLTTGVTPAQFDSSTKLATTQFVQRALGNRQMMAAYSTNQTLTVAQAGMALQYYGPDGGTWTLPSSTATPNGSVFEILNSGGGKLYVQVAGGSDRISVGSAGVVTSITLQQGDSLTLLSSAGSYFYAMGGTGIMQWAATLGVSAPQFDNNTKLATTQFVQRALGNFQNFNGYTTSQTLTAAQAGNVINFWGGSAATFTLPACSSLPAGGAFLFNNSGSAPLTVTRAGSDSVLNGGNSMVLSAGDSLLIVAVPPNQWVATGGSAQLPYASVMSGANWTTAPQFDSSTKLATTAFVKTAGLQFADYVGFATSSTLPPSICGKTVTVVGNNITLTLPLLSSVPIGSTITFHPAGASGTVVQRQGSDTIYGGGGFVASLPLSGTDSITLLASTSSWLPISGSGQTQFSSLFKAQLSSTGGYQKLPSGLILQWGQQGVNTSATVTFPIAFPISVSAAWATAYLNNGEVPGSQALAGAEITSTTTSTMKINCSNPGVRLCGWVAIGY
ncbi:gp53-like domain-containing protein [Ralstonia sp. A12]|uniref:gp53-like domain-containing protein n=1 Tax=Ralstonia sp. A12 TaxID=1217052 RepID=UPI000693A8AA|nr:hypothetical protein [Ralstonia sp. A12]